MSSAPFRLVPSASMNVVGCETNSSVSLDAIQMNRTDSSDLFGSRLSCTKCHRRSESAVAHPTQEPVVP
jgi:hypothetical protein